MRFADRTLFAGSTALVLVGVLAGAGQEQKPAPAGGFETAFPDIPAKDPDKYPCPRFMGRQSIPADRHDLVKRLAKAELDALVEVARLTDRVIEEGRLDRHTLFNALNIYRRIPVVAAEVVGPADELIPWLEERVALTKRLEQWFRMRIINRGPPPYAVQQVRAERFHAEQELLKVMARVKAGPAK